MSSLVSKRSSKVKANNPPSAYALFIKDVRKQLQGEKIGFIELTQGCSLKWKEMSAEEKQKYCLMAKEIREEMLKNSGPSVRRRRKDPKTRKQTSFWNFAQMVRPVVYKQMLETNGVKPQMKEVNKEVGNQWRRLSTEQKSYYKFDEILSNEIVIKQEITDEEEEEEENEVKEIKISTNVKQTDQHFDKPFAFGSTLLKTNTTKEIKVEPNF